MNCRSGPKRASIEFAQDVFVGVKHNSTLYAPPRSDPHPTAVVFGRALREGRTAERDPVRPDLPEARLTAPVET